MDSGNLRSVAPSPSHRQNSSPLRFGKRKPWNRRPCFAAQTFPSLMLSLFWPISWTIGELLADWKALFVRGRPHQHFQSLQKAPKQRDAAFQKRCGLDPSLGLRLQSVYCSSSYLAGRIIGGLSRKPFRRLNARKNAVRSTQRQRSDADAMTLQKILAWPLGRFWWS